MDLNTQESKASPSRGTILTFGNLRGRPVVSVADASKLGTVHTLLLALEERRAIAFRVESGSLFSRDQVVLWRELKAIGPDTVIVADAQALHEENDVAELRDATTLDQLSGARILSEGGEHIGHVTDVDIELASRYITGFILRRSLTERVEGKERVLPAREVISVSREMTVVRDDPAG